jgi:hypothetical protein
LEDFCLFVLVDLVELLALFIWDASKNLPKHSFCVG